MDSHMFVKNTFDARVTLCWLFLVAAVACAESAVSTVVGNETKADLKHQATYRGPVELVLADDESWAVTVNDLSNSLSLVDLKSRTVVDEISCVGQPVSCVKLTSEELMVSCRESGQVRRFAVVHDAG